MAHIRLISPVHRLLDSTDARIFFQNPRNGRWLLIFNNVDDTSFDLSALFPRCEQSAIVVTTRNQALGRLASKDECHLELDVMSAEEAIELLLRCARRRSPSIEERNSAAAIAERLGYLPVALAQAGCYMHEAVCSEEAYLKLLEKHRPWLMSMPNRDCTYATFDISFQRLPTNLQNLVHLLSFFNHSNFPEGILSFGVKQAFGDDSLANHGHDPAYERTMMFLGEIFFPGAEWSHLGLPEMRRTLRNHSIITIEPTATTNRWGMHPLMRDFAYDRIPTAQSTLFRDAACRLLVCAASADHLLEDLPPHIESFMARLNGYPIHMNDRLILGKIMCRMHCRQGQRIMAEIYHALQEENIPNDPRMGTAAGELAVAWFTPKWQRKELATEALRTRQLSIDETEISVIASTTVIMGDSPSPIVSKAEAMERQRLEQSLQLQSCMAIIAFNDGRYAEAERLQATVLEETKVLQGETHPDTLASMCQLARTYHKQDRHSESERLRFLLLGGRRAQLGEAHPETLSAMHDLALTYNKQFRHSEALFLQLQVLKVMKARLGEAHLHTLNAMQNLACTYSQQGQHSKAEFLRVKVLEGRRTQLGETHPKTLNAMENLASTYHQQGRHYKAERLLINVLERRKMPLDSLQSRPEILDKWILNRRRVKTGLRGNNTASKSRPMRIKILGGRKTRLDQFRLVQGWRRSMEEPPLTLLTLGNDNTAAETSTTNISDRIECVSCSLIKKATEGSIRLPVLRAISITFGSNGLRSHSDEPIWQGDRTTSVFFVNSYS